MGLRRSVIALVGSALLGGLLLAGPAVAQDLERGEALWALCTQCHGDAGDGNRMYLAPAIGGLPQWYVEKQLYKFRTGVRGTHFDDIAGMRMRPMALSLRTDEDLKNVSAFVASLPRPEPERTFDYEAANLEMGKQLFTSVCVTCHGQNGEGNEQMGGPPLVGASDWYVASSIANFKARVRGGEKDDALAKGMQPMSYTLATDDAIRDVVAYIRTISE